MPAEINNPVEYLNDVFYDERKGTLEVLKDFIVEGELVVHGEVTIHGYAKFESLARPRFVMDYSKSNRQTDNHVDPQGNIWGKCSTPFLPLVTTDYMNTVYEQTMSHQGDRYIYREGLTCKDTDQKDKKVIIKGDLVVTGNLTAKGAARFGKFAKFDGGVAFRGEPIVG